MTCPKHGGYEGYVFCKFCDAEVIEQEDKKKSPMTAPTPKGETPRQVALLQLWADRCGISAMDERALEPHLYGWPKEYAIYRDGWDAACMFMERELAAKEAELAGLRRERDEAVEKLRCKCVCEFTGSGNERKINKSCEFHTRQLAAAKDEAVRREQEACADICDQHNSIEGIAQKCAEAIRARSSNA